MKKRDVWRAHEEEEKDSIADTEAGRPEEINYLLNKTTGY